MKFSQLLLILSLMFSSGYLTAQNGTISGIVSDEFGELSGAKVELVGTKQNAYCDINGGFKFEVVPGLYTISVSYLMYKPTN